jgi:hypothetical protein
MPTDELAAVRVKTRESLGFAELRPRGTRPQEAGLGNAQAR